MARFILTGSEISTGVRRWKKRSRTCWPKKRKRRKKRKPTIKRKPSRRKSPIRKRSGLRPIKTARRQVRKVRNEKIYSHALRRLPNNRNLPGSLDGVSSMVAAFHKRLRY